ncbi:hypothetical protein F5876DRAFT_71023, partial [Lentinula aff. lateritia]
EPLQGSYLSISATTRSFLSSVVVPVAPFELQPAPSTLQRLTRWRAEEEARKRAEEEAARRAAKERKRQEAARVPEKGKRMQQREGRWPRWLRLLAGILTMATRTTKKKMGRRRPVKGAE